MRKLFTIAVVSLFTMTLSGCGAKKEKESEEPKSTLGAFKELAEKAEELSKKEPVEPVSFQDLKEVLPTSLGGIPRTEVEGQSSNSMGFQMSVAQGVYSEGDKNLRLDLMDLGGVGGVAAAGLAAWTLAESERETQNGYERTIRIDGHKAFEKYDNNTKDSELKVFLNDRFLISLDGTNLTMDEVKAAFRQINFSSLPKN